MRKLSNVSYATTAVQYERIAGGKAWNNPEYATPAHGNIGTTISNVLGSGSGLSSFPFGPGYSFGYVAPGSEPNWSAVSTPNLRFVNGLRFSGFNIAGGGITGDCKVTNLHLYLQYKDETTGYYKYNHSIRWLWQPYKSGGVALIKKMFRSELQPGITPALLSKWTRHPCLKDQNHVTDTYGSGIATAHQSFGQRSFNRVADGWYSSEGFYGYDVDADYNEATSTISTLTVAEINDPNFYVDLWYGLAGFSTSGLVTIYSVGLEVEYIQASTRSNVTLYPVTGGVNGVNSLRINELNTRPWTSPHLAGGTPDGVEGEAAPGALVGNKDAYINYYSDPYSTYENRNNVSDNIIKFDTDYLTAKFPALADLDDTQASVKDMILDIRYAAGNYNSTAYLNADAGRTRWTYVLTDGYPSDHAATYSQPIWRNAILLTEPGIRTRWNDPGYNWQRIGDGYLYAIDEVDPRDETGGGTSWRVKHWPVRLNLGGSGTTPSVQNWGTTRANTTNFPGSVYDPLWVEKALKAGTFYFNLILTLNPGLAVYWNMNPYPQFWFRIDSLSVRVNYNTVTAGPSGPSGPSGDASLLYRFTP
jgi:hypothetical protein